jgi:hypothetical protein
MVIAPPTSNVFSIIDISKGQGPVRVARKIAATKMFGPQHLGAN